MSLAAIQRDSAAERDVIARAGGTADYADAVQARLDANGDAEIARRPIAEILDEIAEEAADLTAWAIVARAQVSEGNSGVDGLLEIVAHQGAEAWSAIGHLRRKTSEEAGGG